MSNKKTKDVIIVSCPSFKGYPVLTERERKYIQYNLQLSATLRNSKRKKRKSQTQ